MEEKMLTATQVDSAIRAGEPVEMPDYGGKGQGRLYLRVRSSKRGTSAVWIVQYFHQGKKRKFQIGRAGGNGLSLRKARERFASVSAQIQDGLDPQLEEEQAAKLAEMEQAAEREAAAEKARQEMTIADVWPEYMAQCHIDKKPSTVRHESSLYKNWILPTIGDRPMAKLAPLDFERLKKAILDAGRSPRTVEYALAVSRQLLNYAENHGLYVGTHPYKKVKRPKFDNRRDRFLSHDEARALLAELAAASQDVHDQALLSLYAGLRWGEISKLKWADVNFSEKFLALRDTKNTKTRHVPMPAATVAMLKRRHNSSEYVFQTKTDKPQPQISSTFRRVVDRMGFNKGVTDRRQRVCFHTLRHTYASWLVQEGTPLLTVGRLLGHSSTQMTERYSHLAPDHFKEAVAVLDRVEEGSTG